MTDIRAPQAGIIVTVRQAAEELRAVQAGNLVAYNIPSLTLAATFAGINVAITETSIVRVQQAPVLAVVRGSIFNPKLRAWTFDLDGHEFYVINLGNDKTLVFDLTTEKWSWWSWGELERWRVQCGVNWTQSGRVAYDGGSDVVVGDDSIGILWTLSPDQGYDDPLYGGDRAEGVKKSFPRAATGQVITRGRHFVPCYEVYLTCDPGEPAFTGAKLELFYSDDAGRSYVSAGEIVVEEGNFNQDIVWRSLGQIPAQGRMFRIEDDGAVRQINEMSISDVN